MGWLDQREHIKNIPIDICYKILRAGVSAEHIADILSCHSVADLKELNWLQGKAFGKFEDSSTNVVMKSAYVYYSWPSQGVGSEAPYNKETNRSRTSTGFYDNDTQKGDELITATNSIDLSNAVRWGISLDDNQTRGKISLAEDYGNNHTFLFMDWLSGRDFPIRYMDSNGNIQSTYGSWSFSLESGNEPAIWYDTFANDKHYYGAYPINFRNLVGGVSLNPYNNGIHDAMFDISFNCDVFKNNDDLDYYLRTGDNSSAINGAGIEPVGGEEGKKYLFCTTQVNNAPTKNGTTYSRHDIELYYDKDVDGYGGTRPCAGYVTTASPYNIKIKVNPASTITKTEIDLHDGTGKHEEEFEEVENPNWTYEEIINSSGTANYYYGILNTNIPIFATEQQVNDYFAGRLSASSALNGGGNYQGKPSSIGNQKQESLFNNLYAPTVLSKTMIMPFATLTEMAGVLFPAEITSLAELVEAMAMFGENPINFISDFYMIAFDPHDFCQTAPNNTMGFGSYYKQFASSWDDVISSNIMPTMCSAYIDGTFNDFRDYFANYYLYMPYVGIVQLDINQYLYHQLTIKALFDARTGNIKYVLLCDGVMTDQYEGCARVSLPITGADAYTSALTKIGGAVDIASGVASTIWSAGSIGVAGTKSAIKETGEDLKELDTSNMLSTTLGNVGKISEGVKDLVKASPKSTTGGFSSGTGFSDQIDFYLIIEQTEIEYPENLVAQYGIPDNDVASIGNYSGYIECDSVKLRTNATATERAEILNILSGGVII